ncbi:MAG: hypothetical protein V2I57_09230 [Xanthomonadales bacterium]|jgi:hypothetical protein|nr:hypothetical protein [Xanthomonadales bacterium]
MENLAHNLPARRRLFRALEDVGPQGASIVIPCQPKKRHGLRWVIAIAVIVGLWGVGMASQLASESLLHQGTAKLERSSVAGP